MLSNEAIAHPGWVLHSYPTFIGTVSEYGRRPSIHLSLHDRLCSKMPFPQGIQAFNGVFERL